MEIRAAALEHAARARVFHLGPIGHLSIFLWSLGTVMLVPMPRLVWMAGLCLLVAAVVNPLTFRRVLRVRFLVMLGLLVLNSDNWVSRFSCSDNEGSCSMACNS